MKIFSQPIYSGGYCLKSPENNSFKFKMYPLSYDMVSFSGKKKDFLDKSEREIYRIIGKSLKSENLIGSGGEADVYQIPDTNYCVRCVRKCKSADRFTFFPKTVDKNITDADKVNHVVAKLGLGDAKILNKISGIPLSKAFHKCNYEKNKFSEISKFPVSSFNTLIRQIANAEKQGLGFDPAPENVIVDLDCKSLIAIDFAENFYASNPMTDLLYVLVDSGTNSVEKKAIAKKVFKSALEEFVPAKQPCFEPERFDFGEAILLGCWHKRFADVLPTGTTVVSFENDFNRLIALKKAELAGEDVALPLEKLLLKINRKLDKAFSVQS